MIKLDLKPADSQLKQFAFIAVVGLPLADLTRRLMVMQRERV